MSKRQIHNEARWALWLTLFYLVGWVISAYFLPSSRGVLGFPLWFEMACLFVPFAFILCISWVVKYRFKEIDLGGEK